jgi:hypothetical protein
MVNEWNKTALVAEFETMLRRRLRSGAAPVAACAGFDLDAASAYLEGALGGSHRADYESHLAGCATCRRHLIELARLAQCAPFADAQPVAAPDRISVWGRWKEAVAVWFDLSSRNLKWQMAGAAGAAFAILIAALGAQSWRQTSNMSRLAATERAPAPSLPESLAQSSQAPTPELLVQADAGFSDASLTRQAIVSSQEPLQATTPAPSVGPQGSAPNIALDNSSTRAFAAPSNLQVEAPSAPTPTPSAPESAQPSQRLTALSAKETMAEQSAVALSGPLQDLKEDTAARVGGNSAQVLRPSPPPGLNPMNPKQSNPILSRHGAALLGERRAKPNPEQSPKSPDKSISRFKEAKEAIYAFVKNPLKLPFSDSEQKPIADTEESADAESANPMVWPFRGKVFIFKKGTWVDQEYKPEMQEWRRFSLTRGSDEFKRVLKDEPQLKEFFDKGPILIVWKNRIYKVLK